MSIDLRRPGRPLQVFYSGSPTILELRIPIGSASLGRRIENGPDRHEVGRAARILAGIRSDGSHLAAPKMANRSVAACEHVETRIVAALGAQRVIVTAELARRVGIEFQAMPAAFFLEGDQPLDRRARDHRQCDALLDVARLAVPRAEERGAHRARPFALRPEHIAVEHERLLVAEKIGKTDGSALTVEPVILRYLSPRGERPPPFCPPLDVPPESDSLCHHRIAPPPIFLALVRKAHGILSRQLG